jgi:uncharacterized protein YjgD (DUF1641 family)
MHADETTRGRTAEVGGVLALLRELKDPRVQETLAFLFAFAKHFGAEQSALSPAPSTTTTS